MISNKQYERLEKDIKKYKFEDVNICLERIKQYFLISPGDAFSYLKEIMFFSISFRNDFEIEIIKYYIKNLKKFSIGKYKFFYKYLKNLKILFHLKRLYRKKIKKLNILKSILISKVSVEYLVERTLQIIGNLQEKKFYNLLNPDEEDINPTIIIDNLRLLFNDINDLKPINCKEIVNISDVFKILLQIDDIVSLESEVVLFGIKPFRIKNFIIIEDNIYSDKWNTGNGKKNSQDFIDRLIKEKKFDYPMLKTIRYKAQHFLFLNSKISYYLNFFNENEEVFRQTYYFPIELEISKLGINIEEAEQICVFNKIKYCHFLKIFEFFTFCNYIFSDEIKHFIEMVLKKKENFIKFLIELLSITKEDGRKMLEMLSSSLFELKDLYLKPLVVLNDDIFFNIKQISYNRICRNLISNFYRYNKTGFNTKYRESCMIDKLVQIISNVINPENIYTNISFNVIIDGCKHSGDIDLIFSKGDDIFVFECKSILNIVDYWEYQRISSCIRKGSHQISKIKEYLKFQTHIKNIDLRGKNIIFAIITTTKVLSGNMDNDIPVVVYEDIVNLLKYKMIYFYNFKLKKSTIKVEDLKKLVNDELFYLAQDNNSKKIYKKSRNRMFHFWRIDPILNYYAIKKFSKKNGFEIELMY